MWQLPQPRLWGSRAGKVRRSQLDAEAVAGTSEPYPQTWLGEEGGSRDGFHLAVNKHASHLGTQRCQSPDPLYPFSRGQTEGELDWGCLEGRMSSFQGVLLPKGAKDGQDGGE